MGNISLHKIRVIGFDAYGVGAVEYLASHPLPAVQLVLNPPEREDELHATLRNIDMLFSIAERRQGVNCAAVCSRFARENGALSVCLTRDIDTSDVPDGIFDAVISVPDATNTNLEQPSSYITIYQIIRAMTGIFTRPSFIGVDISDVVSLLKDAGECVVGIGYAQGDNCIHEAMTQAVEFAGKQRDIGGVSRGLFYFESGESFRLADATDAIGMVPFCLNHQPDIVANVIILDSFINQARITFFLG